MKFSIGRLHCFVGLDVSVMPCAIRTSKCWLPVGVIDRKARVKDDAVSAADQITAAGKVDCETDLSGVCES